MGHGAFKALADRGPATPPSTPGRLFLSVTQLHFVAFKRSAVKQPLSRVSKSKRGNQVVCSICEDVIVDPVGGKGGDDSIHCDGNCSSWLHRRCTGLTKAAFGTLGKSDCPFRCPHCSLSLTEEEIQSLKKLVADLSSHLSLLSDSVDDVKKEVNQHSSASSGADGRTLGDASYAAVAGGVGESAVAGSPKVAVRESATPHYSDSTRKFNLVLFNIPESKLGRLSLSTCQPAPLQSLLTLSATFSGWVNSRRSSEGIVPKFIRCKDARAVLSGSSGLAHSQRRRYNL